MGRINQRALVGRLQRLGVASRAELAKSLGLSQPTSGKIVDQLLELGILEEVGLDRNRNAAQAGAGNGKPKLGRPGRLLQLDRTRPRFLAIQLGITETSLALLPVGADQEDPWAVQVPTPGDAAAWVRQLRKVAAQLHSPGLWGVLVSVPGVVDEEAGRVLFSPNLHWTEGADLSALIRQVWDVPVVLTQEERALALGHQAIAGNSEDFLLVDFGDGVGGAVIVGGRLYASGLPLNGELGHTPVLGNPRPCGCGAVGCVETLVSTRGLLQSLAAEVPGTRPGWPELVAYVKQHGLVPWLANSLNGVAGIIAGALNVLGLRHVVITGSPAELPPEVFCHLSAAIARGSMWGRFGKVECSLALRRRTAGLVAVGIDRLVLPMIQTQRAERTWLSAA